MHMRPRSTLLTGISQASSVAAGYVRRQAVRAHMYPGEKRRSLSIRSCDEAMYPPTDPNDFVNVPIIT